MAGELTFLGGYLQSRHIGRAIAQIGMLTDQGVTSSILLKWDASQNRWFHFGLDWCASWLCYIDQPEPAVIAVGADGSVSVGTAAGTTEERVDVSLDGPARRGPLRGLHVIAGAVYVTGMGRQVYRRDGVQTWTRQDEGVVLARGEAQLCGFNALDGLGEDAIYAVGFNGEIWKCNNGQWLQQDSPTTLVLHKVKVVREDLVFACGQQGILLRNNGGGWKTIAQDVTTDDLWGMEWFQQELYVACDRGLFKLDNTDRLIEVDMRLSPKPSCRRLHANDGVLWSCGPKHVTWTEDGQTWMDVTP
ncbi:WD40/YVTN/BNR-like repeat-containing protein [Xanthomonas vesicatoria]|uniref:Uncharacterized protein n=1 Tax=Xanthomonas vesicatoria ATCC 35937 TaxID=925775 RepID=F0BBA9_9XANT|nr:hypothetical protein [Xanthomonas vesicatoria]APP76959.1 hypothetical protein BJD12_18965 [Xanthomonas vesicatoria ATCC 35937]EGD10288.1 hypothetical protein XVE_1379 [Xanthomonas vesicatoria ATCC 35937]KTF34033.1 hypothetical protein LMG920_07455 [Xanthomonas vesicatoria]KTF35314.1 hypothetical protein LMG919_13685 [Xanthomonas vesicatoria]MCC8557429.1 hypothetical protein [Xanthomonas vesicatoria]